MTRILPRDVDELERMIGIVRTVPVSKTRRDAENLRRKRLGPKWGKKSK